MLADILLRNKDQPQKVGEAINNTFPKEKGKEKESEAMRNALKNIWVNSVFGFIKGKIFDSKLMKDKKAEDEWGGVLKKAGEWKGSSIEEFNRRISKILKKNDYRDAMNIAARNVINYVEDIANALERSGYADELNKIIGINKKKEMKPALDQLINRLEYVAKKTEMLLSLAREGNFSQMLNEITRFDGRGSEDPSLGGVGRMLIRVKERHENQDKKRIVKEYLGVLNNLSGISSFPRQIKDASDKRDYDQVDELSRQIINYVKTMKRTRLEFNKICAMRMDGKKKKRLIAKLFAGAMISSIFQNK